MKYLIVGGKEKKNALANEMHNRYAEGKVLTFDSSTNKVEVVISHITPKEYLPDSGGSVSFSAASIRDNMLLLCTKTEVLMYELKTFKRVLYFSHKYMNDVHHVELHNNKLYVASTGLDAILAFDLEGNLIEYNNVIENYDARERFGEVDFRKIETTKPHISHPNFITIDNGNIWVTRFHNAEIVNLYDLKDKIKISNQMHDGHVLNNSIYYTKVDGSIYDLNKETKIVKQYDLTKIDNSIMHLGWCRGLYPINKNEFIIGFTRLRPTQQLVNVSWIKNFKRELGATRCKPTRIVKYDIKNRKLEWSLNLEKYDMNVVYSILKI